MSGKNRLDQELVRRGIADDKDTAVRLIGAGQIWVNGQKAVKADERVGGDDQLEYRPSPRYVSRGGFKLEGALHEFGIQVEGAVCADVGASTGGFTDCLLQFGASKVYAIDVGRDQLHWKLRQDSRVISMERTDIRQLTEPVEQVDILTIDASFISLEQVLPSAVSWLKEQGQVLALVKPQFEAERSEVGQGGVVRASATQQKVVRQATGWFERHAIGIQGMAASTLRGPKGNQEYFLWGSTADLAKPLETMIAQLFAEE